VRHIRIILGLGSLCFLKELVGGVECNVDSRTNVRGVIGGQLTVDTGTRREVVAKGAVRHGVQLSKSDCVDGDQPE
jgi:hypothetical protein